MPARCASRGPRAAPPRAAGAPDQHGQLRAPDRRGGQLGPEAPPALGHPLRAGRPAGRCAPAGARAAQAVSSGAPGLAPRRRPARRAAAPSRPGTPPAACAPAAPAPSAGGRELVDQLEVAVQVGRAEVGAQRLDHDARHRLRAGDQDVGEPAGRQLHEQVVDGAVGPALDDVEADDVAADRADGGGDGAEHAGAVGQHDAQQEGHDAEPAAPTCPGLSRPPLRPGCGPADWVGGLGPPRPDPTSGGTP